MDKIKLNYKAVLPFVSEDEVQSLKESTLSAAKALHDGNGLGNDFIGWLTLPEDYDRTEFERIQAASKKIQSHSEIFIVIGIGGSYLGSKAAIDFLSHSFYNQLPADQRKTPEIYFAGTNISPIYLQHLMEVIGDRDFSVNMISKSGTTTEPAIAFRILKKKLEDKYGKEGAKDRIFATTDKVKGALKQVATEEGYETFIVPDNVGGRFSVLTAVGLLPIAVAGIDIAAFMEGAAVAMADFKQDFNQNIC
jgi:glucose-6-phosphate isomerase